MSIDFGALNAVDFAALAVLGVSGVLATLRGMTRELMGLAGWPISFVAAKLLAPVVEPVLATAIAIEGITNALAWGIPFSLAVLLWFAFASVISPGIRKLTLGGLDRWLGFMFGLIRGFLVLLVIYSAAVVAAEGEDRLPAIVTDAQTTPVMRSATHIFAGMLPGEMRERIIKNIPAPSAGTEAAIEAGDTLGTTIEENLPGTNSEDGNSGLNLLQNETTN